MPPPTVVVSCCISLGILKINVCYVYFAPLSRAHEVVDADDDDEKN